MVAVTVAEQKVQEVITELKRTGLWNKQIPVWVTEYEEKVLRDEQDFLEWLQFVYLPNCSRQLGINGRRFIVPQAVKFFSDDIKKGKLLQLLIELDSL